MKLQNPDTSPSALPTGVQLAGRGHRLRERPAVNVGGLCRSSQCIQPTSPEAVSTGTTAACTPGAYAQAFPES